MIAQPSNPFEAQPAAAPPVDQANTSAQKSGLVQGAMANAASYAPTQRTVGKNNTVQGQVDSILAKDGPLFARARSMALEQAGSRGLINSSMAVEAAQGAVMDRAMPMAQQDANTYNQVDSENMQATNQASQFNAGEQNQFGRQALDQNFTAGENATQRGFQSSERVAGQQFTAGENVANREAQVQAQAGQNAFTAEQAQIERDAASVRQTAAHAQALEQLGYQNNLATAKVPAQFASGVAETTMNKVNSILGDPDLTPEAKKAAVDNVIAYANSTIAMAELIYGATLPRLSGPTPANGYTPPAEGQVYGPTPPAGYTPPSKNYVDGKWGS